MGAPLISHQQIVAGDRLQAPTLKIKASPLPDCDVSYSHDIRICDEVSFRLSRTFRLLKGRRTEVWCP